VSLIGQAQGVHGNISSKSKDYDSLVKALKEHFEARPSSLNDAVRHVVELEAFLKAERNRPAQQGIVSSVDQPNAN